MSKQIKQMEMDVLRGTFREVKDLVVLSSSGVDAQADNSMRLALRKKNIRMQVVKNSLVRRVFGELGLQCESFLQGPTVLAWGGDSLKDLSREVETFAKKNKKLVLKGAMSEGQAISFAQALKMPSRTEAIGRVVGLVLSPAARLVSQIAAPGARIAAQIKTLEERTEAAPAEAAAAPAAG